MSPGGRHDQICIYQHATGTDALLKVPDATTRSPLAHRFALSTFPPLLKPQSLAYHYPTESFRKLQSSPSPSRSPSTKSSLLLRFFFGHVVFDIA